MTSPRALRRTARVVVGVAMLLLAWLGVRAYQIASHLSEARHTLTGLAGGSGLSGLTGDADLGEKIHSALRDADTAREAADDPVWRAMAAVPVAGRSFAVVRGLAVVTDDFLHRTAPPALEAAQLLAGHRLVEQGQVNLTLLSLIRDPLERAAAGATLERGRAHGLSTRFVPATLGHQRDALLGQVDRVTSGLVSAVRTLSLTTSMLGRNGPRRYFVAVMNQAESRAAGGLVGAYAVLRADGGRITKERVGTDLDFHNAPRPVVDLGTEFARNYDGEYVRSSWTAQGASPHWPDTSRTIAGLWAAQGGGPLDGVIGLDPQSLADILDVTGPVTLDGQTLTGTSVAPFILRDEYAQFGDNDALRHRILGDLAGAIFQRVIDGAAPPGSFIRALGHAAGDGHLLVYSSHAAEQAALSGTRVAGEVPNRWGAYLGLITQNIASNKLDSYLRRRVDYSRSRPGVGRMVVTLTNLVPPHAPRVVLQRLDHPATPQVYGETRVLLTIYCSVGSEVRSMTVNGVPTAFAPGVDRGHGTATIFASIRPGRPTVLVADISDPGGPLTYLQQDTPVPDLLDLQVPVRGG